MACSLDKGFNQFSKRKMNELITSHVINIFSLDLYCMLAKIVSLNVASDQT